MRPRPGIFSRDPDDGDYDDTFCIVCGIPITVLPEIQKLDTSKNYEWCLDAVALRAPNIPQRHIPWDEQRYHGYGQPIEIVPVQGCTPSTQCGVSWVGMHRKCSQLMQRLLEYRVNVLHLTPDNTPRAESVSTCIPTNLGEMYEVYQSRLDDGGDASGLTLSYVWKPLEPHKYYYDPCGERQVDLFPIIEWPFGSPDVVQHERAPFPIPDLLPQILAYLQPLSVTSADASSIITLSVQSKLDSLPVEIQDEIYKSIHPFINPPEQCTRNLSPLAWKELLFCSRLLPWLWDLDQSARADPPLSTSYNANPRDANVDASVKLFGDENLWDWELLVRQLAQVNVFEPGGVMESAPLALRNRRRIWRLLDEARRNDVDIFFTRPS